MRVPVGIRAESVRIRRASIAVSTRYSTPRESLLLHASYLTDGDVENRLAPASAASTRNVECDAFGESRGRV